MHIIVGNQSKFIFLSILLSLLSSIFLGVKLKNGDIYISGIFLNSISYFYLFSASYYSCSPNFIPEKSRGPSPTGIYRYILLSLSSLGVLSKISLFVLVIFIKCFSFFLRLVLFLVVGPWRLGFTSGTISMFSIFIWVRSFWSTFSLLTGLVDCLETY